MLPLGAFKCGTKEYVYPKIASKLDKYECPSNFDYLSIDTEGSEFEIIDSLNFNKYLPKIITIEHNYKIEKRDKIYNLLIKHGYKRVFKDISNCDDWYIVS